MSSRGLTKMAKGVLDRGFGNHRARAGVPSPLSCRWMKSISIPHRVAASLFGLAWLALGALTSFGQNDRRAGDLLRQPEEWFRGAEGRRITTNVLSWQSAAGSWPKNRSTTRTPYVGDNAGLKGT